MRPSGDWWRPRLITHQGLAHLVAEPLDVGLCELLALAKLCDPAIYFMFHSGEKLCSGEGMNKLGGGCDECECKQTCAASSANVVCGAGVTPPNVSRYALFGLLVTVTLVTVREKDGFHASPPLSLWPRHSCDVLLSSAHPPGLTPFNIVFGDYL